MRKQALVAMTALLTVLAGPASAAESGSPFGLWHNPKRSVVVRIEPCSDKLCGVVVWATPAAQATVRQKTGTLLVGAALLKDYRPDSGRNWRGKVLVPDMGRQFSSSIAQVDRNTLDISGCLIGTMLCKHQRWERVNGALAQM